MEKGQLLISVKNCSKSFNGITVFDKVCFELHAGEIHCLCGENGAGKSTFIKILSGAYIPDEGDIVICGEKIQEFQPGISRRLGVQTIYQNQFLMSNLSVAENIFMGEYDGQGLFINHKKMIKDAQQYLDMLGLKISPETLVGRLDVADRQTIQIARALANNAKVLILDEPTASYGKKEQENLLNIVKKLASQNLGIIYSSHHLDEVFELADTVTVLRDGKRISCYSKNEIDKAKIIRDMVGRDTSLFYQREDILKQNGILKFDNIYKTGYVEKSSFDVNRGEIVGFGGMVGSGRTELMTLISGSVKPDEGRIITEKGENILPDNPTDAIKKGIVYIPEDRQSKGIFAGHNIGWNFNSAQMNKFRGFLVRQKKSDIEFMKFQNDLDIKSTGPKQGISFLSGGNQQKVVIAKWLYTNGDVYIFDEPTKGIDIGAKEDVYHLMTNLAKQGKYIILVSSDMPELIAMSDRVYVMRNRKIVKELIGNDVNEETILSYAIG